MESENLNQHTPDAEDILNEAQRRIKERMQQQVPPRRRTLVKKLNRLVFWLARHWLAVFNTLTGLFLGGALLAPVLLKIGLSGMAHLLYMIYARVCHQYPFRSWFFFGPHMAYPLTNPIHIVAMNKLSDFNGDAQIGYKTALCQRDIAIYGCILLAGLLYGVLRTGKRPRPWPMWQYFIFGILPMLLDGGIQWLSYFMWVFFPSLIPEPFETTPLMRTLTGIFFGVGIVATAYPYLNEYFEDVYHTLQRKFSEADIPWEVTAHDTTC
ncbi:MAG TPA: DUF2085 domain-containing protein [Anaerolineae bacterium]|nr:DUF2085 domain-containing protein [Anaerolineae bacterium]HQH38115.1 DUF2085 domain-containing protein [Anaerolineae bacterium]